MIDEETPIYEVDLNRPSMVGRPAKYKTAEELEVAIDAYFRDGVKMRQIVVGTGKTKRVELVPIPTITGLVLYLGFADRHSFYEYEKKKEFSHTIKKARTFIENEYEEILVTTGNAGAIFALKNFGWHDRTELELSAGVAETREKIGGILNEPDDSGADDVHDDGEETDGSDAQ